MSFFNFKRLSSGSAIRSDEDTKAVPSKPAGNPLRQFGLPRLQQGLSEVVSAHPSGTTFPYAAISSRTDESQDSILHRLRNAVNRPKKVDTSFSNIPPSILTMNHQEIKLTALESKKLKSFVRIKEIRANYTPLISVYDKFTPAIFELHDLRHNGSTLRRSHTINSTISDTFRFELDYCVPKDRLDCFVIVVKCETTGLNDGEIWGVIKFKVDLESASDPYQTDMNSTMAVMQLPGTFLSRTQVDPRFLNLTMDGEAREEMILMHQRGDITTTDKPQSVKSIPVGYAGTTYGPATQVNTAQNPTTRSPATDSWVQSQASPEVPVGTSFSNLRNADGKMIKKSATFAPIPEENVEVAPSFIPQSHQIQSEVDNPIFAQPSENVDRYGSLSSVGSETPSQNLPILNPTGVEEQDDHALSFIDP